MATPGIIFDLDDTLIDSTRAHAAALLEIGLSLDAPAYEQARNKIKGQLGNMHVSSHNRVLYFKAMLDAKEDFSANKVLELMRTYENALYRFLAVQWAVLERAKLMVPISQVYPIAVLTNETTRAQLVKLSAIDPNGTLFPVVVTSEEIGFEKPDLRAFAVAAERLGRSLSECWVVGDSWEDDIEPALRLGCKAILIQEFCKSKRFDTGDATIVSNLNDIVRCMKIPKAA